MHSTSVMGEGEAAIDTDPAGAVAFPPTKGTEKAKRERRLTISTLNCDYFEAVLFEINYQEVWKKKVFCSCLIVCSFGDNCHL